MSNSGPRPSSDPVRNGRPASGESATTPSDVVWPQKHVRVQRRSSAGRARHPAAGAQPGLEHRVSLPAAHALRRRRAAAVEGGGLIALVGVRERVDHRVGARHVARAAHPRLEQSHRRPEVILGVDLVLRRVHGPVVGEGREGAERHPRAVRLDAVDSQDADERVDRVRVAVRVLRDRARPRRLDDPVVGEVRLEAAVVGDPEQPGGSPGRLCRADVAVRPPQRGRDPLDEEGVDLGLGRTGCEEVHERGRVGDRRGARRERVQGGEVGELRRAAVRVGGADEDVLLTEAVAGALRRLGDEPSGRGEQVHRDQRDLAVPSPQDDR